ncbi:MAG: Fic family protein [Deltaproteobacteria bacterium]|jgi:hypothetical protein|nr:Fic family protein [Deltaproteobacteria bacterium]
MPERDHGWEPITDLPRDWLRLSDPEISSVRVEWLSIRMALKPGALTEFREKISREWAIETGKVESLYDIGSGLTRKMIDEGLDSVELSCQTTSLGAVEPIIFIRNQYDVVESLYKEVLEGWPLTPHTLRSLHAAFVENQDFTVGMLPTGELVRIPMAKGIFKKWPNNPLMPDGRLHQYCPPEQVASEIDRLLAMHAKHQKYAVPSDIEAAWLHHRFVQIHPFQDGNGRVARVLAALEYIKDGFFPPVVTADSKTDYIYALDKANDGDLKPFVRYLSGLALKQTCELMDLAKRPENRGLFASNPVVDS